MKIPSKSGEEQTDKNEELTHLLNHIEREWETLKQGKLRNTRRCSTASASSSSSFLEYSLENLLDNSPRELMHSLQRRGSPSDGFFRERNLDAAVEEVFQERRDAIMSGRIKGRRLFTEGTTAVELDLNYDDDGGGDSLSMSGERDLPDTVSISCLSDDSLSEEKEVVAEEKGCPGGSCGGSGGGCKVGMPWLLLLLILVILGVISMSCYGKYVRENELLLVPT